MSETEFVLVGDEMPVIRAVGAAGPASVTVEWAEGPRTGLTETIDLAPAIFSYRMYAPLRDNAELFGSVRTGDDGHILVWDHDPDIEMAATTVEHLAEEAMTNADFAAFLKRNRLSLDAAAARLGISRRLVAYYAKNRAVPRYIALACARIEERGNHSGEVETKIPGKKSLTA